MRKIAVFDTNILFSGAAWKGTPYQCIELARTGVVDGITCQEILDELAEKLQLKLLFTTEQCVEALADLLTCLRVVPITGQFKAVPADPDDDKVFECAVMAGATHVITGDRRHLLPIGVFQGIQIVTATEFLAAAANP